MYRCGEQTSTSISPEHCMAACSKCPSGFLHTSSSNMRLTDDPPPPHLYLTNTSIPIPFLPTHTHTICFTWLAKIIQRLVLSSGSLNTCLTSWSMGVIPVPPAIIPTFFTTFVSASCFLSGWILNTPVPNETANQSVRHDPRPTQSTSTKTAGESMDKQTNAGQTIILDYKFAILMYWPCGQSQTIVHWPCGQTDGQLCADHVGRLCRQTFKQLHRPCRQTFKQLHWHNAHNGCCYCTC